MTTTDLSVCIICGRPVAPGEGAQAVPPFPAMHTKCLGSPAAEEPRLVVLPDPPTEPIRRPRSKP